MPKNKEKRGYKKKELKETAKKTVKKLEEKMEKVQLKDILTKEQYKKYLKASPQRQLWLEYFVRTGDSTTAAESAYPKMTRPSQHVMSYHNRQYFGINVAMLFRALGIDETIIVKKTTQLLNAKRIKRTFIKGDLTEETEEEDNFAIAKGLDYATKLTGNDPGQKIKVGEDPENPFNSLADALRSIVSGKPIEQPKEE